MHPRPHVEPTFQALGQCWWNEWTHRTRPQPARCNGSSEPLCCIQTLDPLKTKTLTPRTLCRRVDPFFYSQAGRSCFSTFIFSLSGQPQLLAGGTRAHMGGLALPSSWGHESKRGGPSASPGLPGTPFLFGSPDSSWKLEPRDRCTRDRGKPTECLHPQGSRQTWPPPRRPPATPLLFSLA